MLLELANKLVFNAFGISMDSGTVFIIVKKITVIYGKDS